MGQVFLKKGRSAHVYLLMSLILFSPIIYIGMKSGGMNFRNGQFLVLYFFLYLMSAVLIYEIATLCANFFYTGIKAERSKYYIFASLIVVCLFLQGFIGVEKNQTFYALTTKTKVHNAYGFSFWQGEFNAKSGWANQTTRDASKWMTKNIPTQETILCQWSYLRMLDYLTDNQYDFQKIEYRFSHENMNKKALFIWPRYDARVMSGNSLVALYEEDFLSQVNTDRIKYVVVTSRRNFLTLYLQDHTGFKQIHSITRGNNNIKIFKTTKFPVDPNLHFNVKLHEDVIPFFQIAARENRMVLNNRMDEIKQILNWDGEHINSFVDLVENQDQTMFWQTYEKVESRRIY